MEYLLSQEEYDALKSLQVNYNKKQRDQLMKFCQKIADTLPQKDWRYDQSYNPEIKPWGCILTVSVEYGDEWYCDDCPCQDVCPYERKHWSK